jgi:hypothetical protein
MAGFAARLGESIRVSYQNTLIHLDRVSQIICKLLNGRKHWAKVVALGNAKEVDMKPECMPQLDGLTHYRR